MFLIRFVTVILPNQFLLTIAWLGSHLCYNILLYLIQHKFVQLCFFFLVKKNQLLAFTCFFTSLNLRQGPHWHSLTDFTTQQVNHSKWMFAGSAFQRLAAACRKYQIYPVLLVIHAAHYKAHWDRSVLWFRTIVKCSEHICNCSYAQIII